MKKGYWVIITVICSCIFFLTFSEWGILVHCHPLEKEEEKGAHKIIGENTAEEKLTEAY